ncbi:hypothetical protein [Actinotignum timonense]|uniref:hypothetical protein n=1 Tax=Actinotignum timonense TaxID=1870995 RepID=UPI002A817FF5|nr:hypothetical protein [Actinotignum timonense]MDY5142785.1 hypothetical protein [Actinotignum timonense]
MKKPDTHALRTLKKAPITNPVVAASTETPAVPAGNASNAGNTTPASTSSKRGVEKVKIPLRLPRETADIIRGAWLADVATGNRISLSEWATTIITDHINTDVTPVPAGATPKGII